MELKKLYLDTKKKILESGIDTPGLEASILIRESLGVSNTEIYTRPEAIISENDLERFSSILSRRLEGEPSGYITGKKEFYSREFLVNSDVLIPRPETELLVDRALELIPRDSEEFIVMEIGSGSGCIGVTLALERKGARVIATDISYGAVNMTRLNANKFGVQNRFFSFNADLCSAFIDSFVDMVVSNPPYISDTDYDVLPRDIREFEPAQALRGGIDGMDIIRKLIHDAANVLKNNGLLIMEIGYDQAERVTSILKNYGYRNIRIYNDLNGINRMVSARWKK